MKEVSSQSLIRHIDGRPLRPTIFECDVYSPEHYLWQPWNVYSNPTVLPLAPIPTSSRARAPIMLFSSYILALTVYFPLLVHSSPTVSSKHKLPPPLSKHKLGLVRKHAINISHHRFVCSPSTPSPSSSIHPHYDGILMNDTQLGTGHACGGTDRVRVAPPLGVRSSVHPATGAPQKGRGERCALHRQEVRLFFSFQTFPTLGSGDALC